MSSDGSVAYGPSVLGKWTQDITCTGDSPEGPALGGSTTVAHVVYQLPRPRKRATPKTEQRGKTKILRSMYDYYCLTVLPHVPGGTTSVTSEVARTRVRGARPQQIRKFVSGGYRHGTPLLVSQSRMPHCFARPGVSSSRLHASALGSCRSRAASHSRSASCWSAVRLVTPV